MFIAWTTVANRAEADRLAAEAVQRGLAACVQIEGPVTSVYRWEGKLEQSAEWRLVFKCRAADCAALEAFVLGAHPYETPEWVAVRADRVGEKYLSWAEATVHSPTL